MTQKPTFSLLYTSAREAQIPDVIRRWVKASDARWDLQFCITTDGGEWRGSWDSTLNKLCVELKIRRSQFIIAAVKKAPFNCGRGWELAAKISSGMILVCVSDDLHPCQDWDMEIIEALIENKADIGHKWVMHVDDGGPEKKLTHPIMSRARYDEVGYFFYPHFASLYNDDEIWRKAERDGVLIDAKHILIKHVHHYFKEREFDAVDAVHSSDSRYDDSKRLFDWLVAKDFPKPLGQVPKGPEDYVCYMQVIKDDFFLLEICKRLIEEGVRKFFFHLPSHGWNGEPADTLFENGVRLLCEQLESVGCACKYASAYSKPIRGETRIQTETRVRNDALREMRSIGWHFALIVDSDELWVKGTLAKVHELAAEGVQAIRVKMRTVAGMPPNAVVIDGKDYANCYIGPDTEFHYCRNAVAPMHTIEDVGVYHFSAVRRTKELLIEKMKGSGHYGEAGYNFDKWIEETLPRIAVGEKNLHMHDKVDLWPEGRAWTDEDKSVLPLAIKEFLGL